MLFCRRVELPAASVGLAGLAIGNYFRLLVSTSENASSVRSSRSGVTETKFAASAAR